MECSLKITAGAAYQGAAARIQAASKPKKTQTTASTSAPLFSLAQDQGRICEPAAPAWTHTTFGTPRARSAIACWQLHPQMSGLCIYTTQAASPSLPGAAARTPRLPLAASHAGSECKTRRAQSSTPEAPLHATATTTTAFTTLHWRRQTIRLLACFIQVGLLMHS